MHIRHPSVCCDPSHCLSATLVRPAPLSLLLPRKEISTIFSICNPFLLSGQKFGQKVPRRTYFRWRARVWALQVVQHLSSQLCATFRKNCCDKMLHQLSQFTPLLRTFFSADCTTFIATRTTVSLRASCDRTPVILKGA